MTPKRKIVPIFVPHAGCRHNCVFCNQRRISGVSIPAGAEDVRDAILRADSAGEPAELAFYGGSFTAIPTHIQDELLSAAKPFLARHPDNSIRVSTRPDCIDRRTAIRLRDYGVRTIELGAQSMCGDVLSGSRRGHMPEDVVSSAEIIKNEGLCLVLQMMTGLPLDTWEKSIFTAKQFIRLVPDGVRIYPTVVVRGTELYEMWRRGEYKEHTLTDAVALCAELCRMFEKANIPVIRLGLNPSEQLGVSVAAGAYHPALGELVYSRMYLDRALAQMPQVPPNSDIILYVAKGKTSIMTGQHRCNITELTSRFNLRSVKVMEGCEVSPGKIIVEIRE